MNGVIAALIIGFLLFEIIEHVVFPLIWVIKDRKRKSACGTAGMLGKVGEIRCWREFEGRIFVDGELWKASGDVPFSAGDRAVVEKVEGLTLKVSPFK